MESPAFFHRLNGLSRLNDALTRIFALASSEGHSRSSSSSSLRFESVIGEYGIPTHKFVNALTFPRLGQEYIYRQYGRDMGNR